MPRVLLVEDEPAIADTLLYALKTENFDVSHVGTGREALAELEIRFPDLIVLDVGLPDVTGFDLCRTIRDSSQVPILFLTARDSEIDQVLGLELGGDDYVTKPFSPRAVVARIRAILRRGQSVADADNNAASGTTALFHHDADTMTVTCRGECLDLTAHEYKLLAVLLSKPGRVFSRDQLLEQAWEDPAAIMDRTVDAHVKSLRAKLRAVCREAGDAIQTRRGLGYTLVV